MTEEGIAVVKEVRVEMRLRNNRLWNLIFPRWDSIASFCRDLKIYQPETGQLLNLRIHPISKTGMHRPTCDKIANYFGVSSEYLFPPDIYELEKTEGSAELGIEEIPYHQCVLLPAPDFEEFMNEKIGSQQLVEQLLRFLKPRDRKCVEMKMGLGGFKPHTFAEIGDEFGVTKSRAEQIFNQVIWRIGRSARGKILLRNFECG